MGAEAHINACYKHFFYFVNHFKLVDKRELEPLVSLVLSYFLVLFKRVNIIQFILFCTHDSSIS